MAPDLMISRFYENMNKHFSIPVEDFEPFKKILKVASYKKGEQVLKIGDIETHQNAVITGTIHQYVFLEGRQVTIDITLSDMYFNSLKSYMENSPSQEVHEAITDVELVYFEKVDFEKLLEAKHWICFVYLKILENILLERENRSFLLQHNSAKDKFKLFIESDKCAQRYLKEVSQKLVAQYLGMAPETYSKVKKEYFQNN